MRQKPIGVFDSGLGGLTAVKELRRILPAEDIVYFGDTGRVPYGSRGRDIIITYTRQDVAFLLQKNVKTLLAACGTISSTFPKEDAARLPVPYMGVVEAAVQKAAQTTRNGRIGIIGTEATVASRSYQTQLAALSPDVECFSAACPLFVPLVENGHFAKDDAMAALAVQEYLPRVRDAGVDTVILGCTHYPLLADMIAGFFGDGVTLVDTGREAALMLKENMEKQGLLRKADGHGRTEYYVSDDPTRFGRLAAIFLGDAEEETAHLINIEDYQL